MKLLYLSIMFIYTSGLHASSFTKALRELKNHEQIKALQADASSLAHLAKVKGSWGNPKLKLAAKNFSTGSFDYAGNPMTGIELGLTQKLPLTNKYNLQANTILDMKKAKELQRQLALEKLSKKLWESVILERLKREEISILKDNLVWLQKMSRVTQKLYATGKVSQANLLDIQTRTSELAISLSNKDYELQRLEPDFRYLMGESYEPINPSTIPWTRLFTSKKKGAYDVQEKIQQVGISSKQKQMKAEKMARVPDLMWSLGYTFRADPQDNLITSAITFDLPFSDSTKGTYKKTAFLIRTHQEKLVDYKNQRQRNGDKIKSDIAKVQHELSLLKNQTLVYAHNARDITATSYGLGNASYIELLQAELKLQQLLMRQAALRSHSDLQRVKLKFTLGESLYE